MAAEAVLPSVVEKLGDLLIQEAIFLRSVTDEAEGLRHQLRWMQCFLRDADRKELVDERVRNWVMEVRDAAYDAEDAIDTYIYRIARQRRRGWMGALKRCAFFITELSPLHELGVKIKHIKQKIDNISESRSKFGIENLVTSAEETNSANQVLRNQRQFSALLEQSEVVGFEEDRNVLMDRLIKGGSRKSVVSLVGIGGSGKTTLAKKIYNCSDVKSHFSFRGLVYVSQDFRPRDPFLSVIKCFTSLSEDVEKMKSPELAKKISDHLQDKRYLVVIDDIWEKEHWDLINYAFPDNKNGSRIMLTTRKEDVALYADPLSPPHKLCLLGEDESWSLFINKVFGREDNGTSCPSQLENIGKQIVKRCGGLPLATVVLGGLVSTREKNEHAWSNILKHVNRYLSDGENSCSEILALSYSDLPYHLKPCFLYIGVFPEDTDIPAERLVRYWMAEGFIRDDRGLMEDVGQEYLEELVRRNMIQVVKRRRWDMRLVKCRIHDLMRDLCIEEAKQNRLFEIVRENMDASESFTHIRRLVINRSDLQLSESCIPPHLRSLLCLGKCPVEKLNLGNMRLLRRLQLSRSEETKISSKIHKLIHLKYLSFQPTSKRLSFLSSLLNLQVLEITCSWRRHLRPNVFRSLKQLRHLDLWSVDIDGLHLEYLSNLQTLYLRFCRGTTKGFKNLTNLRELHLAGDYELYEKGVSFQHHNNLECIYFDGPFQIPNSPDEFPPNLAKLTYRAHQLSIDTTILPTLEKLPNLHILTIGSEAVSEVVGREIVFSGGGFSRLEALTLRGLYLLEECRIEEGALPALQHLKIKSCKQLKMIPQGLQHMTSLKKLELVALSEEFKARLAENGEEDRHKLWHISSIVIN